MFGVKKCEKRESRIPWKKGLAATGLCLFFIGFVAVFGCLLPQGNKQQDHTGDEDVKDTRRKKTKNTRSIGMQCAIATTAMFVLIVAAWILWEKPWDKSGADETVYLDFPEGEARLLATEELSAGAAAVTEPEEEEKQSTEESQPEGGSVTSEEEVPEDEMTVLIESSEPLPQPQVASVANETISAHRNAVAGDIVFVGDSRTVGMSSAVPGGDIYIAKVGAGYDWFSSTAIPEVNDICGEGTIIVINMGVNDLGNAVKYANRVNGCIEEWSAKGIHVAYMSVNPVVDGHSNASNAKVERFNSIVSSSLDGRVAWIDTYSSLVANGYATQDGLHYKNATYRQIYDLCVSRLSSIFPTPGSEEESVSENEAAEGESVSENAAQEGENNPDTGTQDPNNPPTPDQTDTADPAVQDGQTQTTE